MWNIEEDSSRAMAISPATSPQSAFENSSSPRHHMQRSSSRMSFGSKQGEGSRASDEDGKTAVKVGECGSVGPPMAEGTFAKELINFRDSCASAPTLRIDRSWVRIDSSTTSETGTSGYISHKPCCRFISRPETLRI